jgi:hypothetical protein
MKRGLLTVLGLTFLAGLAGCGTVGGGIFHEAMPFDVRYNQTSGGTADWMSYRAIEIGQISPGTMGSAVPASLMADLQPFAQQELAKEGILQGTGKMLLVTGEVTDYYQGSSSTARAVGFGDNPALTVRAKFIDRASGKVLAEVVLVSQSKSLRDWEEMVSRGLGHSVANYLDSKGIHKPKPDKN